MTEVACARENHGNATLVRGGDEVIAALEPSALHAVVLLDRLITRHNFLAPLGQGAERNCPLLSATELGLQKCGKLDEQALNGGVPYGQQMSSPRVAAS
jgi:hypothetical protein